MIILPFCKMLNGATMQTTVLSESNDIHSFKILQLMLENVKKHQHKPLMFTELLYLN